MFHTMDKTRLLAADSGGSKTHYRLLDLSGNILAESRSAGIASLHPGQLPVKESLCDGIAKLGMDVGDASLLYFSLGGPNGAEVESALREILPRTRIIVDREANGNMILNMASLFECSAAVMIGTGSVAVGMRNGKRVFSGGWGEILDDLGSGGHLGFEALQCYLFSVDGRAECGKIAWLFKPLAAGLDLSDFNGRMELKRRANLLSRRELAALVPELFHLADGGETIASGLIAKSAKEIVRLAVSVTEEHPAQKGILACGGMFQSGSSFRKTCMAELAKVRPFHEWRFLNTDGMISGAAIMALQKEGVTDRTILLKQLGEQYESCH